MTMPFFVLALVGLLLFGVISGGVTAHKVMWGLLGLALLGVAIFGALLCTSGFKDVPTGLSLVAWWGLFVTLFIAPLLGYGYAVVKLFRWPRLDKKDVPPEVS
jgi:hypothetical protein